MTIRIAFAGTPDFAAVILKSLLKNDALSVELVFSQPARPKGRGLEIEKSPVETHTIAANIPVHCPVKWSEKESALIKDTAIDYLITVAYGLILPSHAIEAPSKTALNVHASLLPKWRGAAPIQRAIKAGDEKTGISIFSLEKTLDTGPILSMDEIKILPDETSAELHDRLAILASKVLPETIIGHFEDKITPTPQNHEESTYASKIQKKEGRLSWDMPADEIYRTYRSFNPWPGVVIENFKLIKIQISNETGNPGEIISLDPLVIATADSSLQIDQIQKAGKKAVTGPDFANGQRLKIGDQL